MCEIGHGSVVKCGPFLVHVNETRLVQSRFRHHRSRARSTGRIKVWAQRFNHLGHRTRQKILQRNHRMTLGRKRVENAVHGGESRNHSRVQSSRVIHIRRLAGQHHQLLQRWFTSQPITRMHKLQHERRRLERRKDKWDQYISSMIKRRVRQFLSRADQGGWGAVD